LGVGEGGQKQHSTTGKKKKLERELKKTLPPPIKDDKSLTKVVALDCEMVGVGVDGQESMLARVCIINSYGNVVYDKFVKPRERVVDYRTWVSGVTKAHLEGDDAFPFDQIQHEVAEIIKDRIVVGHGLVNDFRALLLSHPFSHVRDTSKYRPLQRSRGRPRALGYLARQVLGVRIQDKARGAHDPAEDARAALLIYKHHKRDWEEYILKKQKQSRLFSKKKKKKAKKQKKKEEKKNQQQGKAKSENGAEMVELSDDLEASFSDHEEIEFSDD